MNEKYCWLRFFAAAGILSFIVMANSMQVFAGRERVYPMAGDSLSFRDKERVELEECAICYDGLARVELPCCHAICKNCRKQIFRCPFCKHNLAYRYDDFDMDQYIAEYTGSTVKSRHEKSDWAFNLLKGLSPKERVTVLTCAYNKIAVKYRSSTIRALLFALKFITGGVRPVSISRNDHRVLCSLTEKEYADLQFRLWLFDNPDYYSS